MARWREIESKTTVELFGEKWGAKPHKSSANGEGFVIDMTEMYENPETCGGLEFAKLAEISEHFGTQKIDVDDISEGGCETCDWGSRYGWEVQVYGATKNAPTFN